MTAPAALQRALTKYLAQHAVTGTDPAKVIASALPWPIEHLLVVPVFAESTHLATRIDHNANKRNAA